MSCCGGNKGTSSNKVFERSPEEIKYPGRLQQKGSVDLPTEENAYAPTTDQERDFARIFIDTAKGTDSQHIFLLFEDDAPGSGDGDRGSSLKPLVSKSDKAGQTGDPEVVEEVIEEFVGVLKDSGGDALKSWTDAELRVVIKYISVDLSFFFCTSQQLSPVFLQPKYLILLGQEGISVLNYGFVCDPTDMRIEGRTPQDKKTPWVVRLEVEVKKPKKVNYAVIHGDGTKVAEKDTKQFLEDDLHELKRRTRKRQE